MWFESIIRRETGCASYMLGSDETGECAVFDPLFDVTPFVTMARRHRSRIRYVIDAHSHADHVSGARRLVASCLDAELVLPALAEITYDATRVTHGDKFQLGEVTMEVVHVPGHRPEQINLLVTDHARGDEPWFMLTADFLLIGDLARPDLAQAGEAGAEVLFDVALPRLEPLPDFLEIYPGHLSGST